MAVVGLPLHLSATGTVVVVTVLLHKGLSPGAAMALMLSGPAANLHILRAFKRSYSSRAAVVFGAAVVGAAVAIGLEVNAFASHPGVPGLHEWAQTAPSIPQTLCLGVISVLTLSAVLRCGPRRLLGRLWFALDHAHPEEPSLTS